MKEFRNRDTRVGSRLWTWHFAAMTERLNDELALGAGFPAAAYEGWRQLVDEVLKGGDFDNKLVARTLDGLRIEPLYPRNPGARPIIGRAPGARWAVMQRIDHPQPEAANSQALHDLANGATGLAIECAGSIGAHGYGLAPEQTTIARALEEIELESRIAIDLDLGPQPSGQAEVIAALLERGGASPASSIRFGLDPIGTAALAGGAELDWNSLERELTATIAKLVKEGFAGPFAVADARVVHGAGGSEAQELAYALAVAVAYLRALEAAGMAIELARRMLYFRMTADADQFLTVCKFRALRKLWARIEEACGLDPRPAFITAETAWRMMTRRDPYVNLLRSTIAVAAAGLGGANAIMVLPFTMALGLPDAFARRLARNTQLVLLDESNLARVGDPAAGSGAVESLTEQLCRAGWSQFQAIEKAGGAFTALERGEIQASVASVRAQRQAAVALRKEALIGTTEYADLAELPVATTEVPRAEIRIGHKKVQFEPLASFRLAEPFEQLRDVSDQMLSRSGARPKVFLANIGSISEFGARAAFAASFFAAGGIEAVTNDGFSDCEELIAAYNRSGTKFACLCSSDHIYVREALAMTEALREAGASVWMAGRPRSIEPAVRRAGVSGFIFSGCDAIAALRQAHSLVAT
jgi:methylmalonyl-CoA mutase